MTDSPGKTVAGKRRLVCKERKNMFPTNEQKQSFAEEKKLHSSEHDETLSRSQLWSAIEFSAQFPDLTIQLVSSLKTTEAEHAQEIKVVGPAAEQLEFPTLEAPDPRKRRGQLRKEHAADSAAQTREAELELRIANQLESVATPPLPIENKRMGPAWAYILMAVFLFSLWWIYGLAGFEQQTDIVRGKGGGAILKKETEELHLQARK